MAFQLFSFKNLNYNCQKTKTSETEYNTKNVLFRGKQCCHRQNIFRKLCSVERYIFPTKIPELLTIKEFCGGGGGGGGGI